MMRYLIQFSYDGSHFNGFQRLKDYDSVQKSLEDALSILNKSEVLIKGAGRTDVGVHANGQCAHFDLNIEIPAERLKTALNSIVHPYIHIVECRKVSDDFHARFSVKRKKYAYKIWCGEYDPKKFDYYLMYTKEIDVNKLKECASVLIGKHDFHNFVSGSRDNYDMEIEDIEVIEKGMEIDIVFTGKSFYRYMVRNLVGAILDYNEGKCDIALLKKMLEEKNFDYQLSCATAKGLYLEGVYYGR